jgi:hypothetical protein
MANKCGLPDSFLGCVGIANQGKYWEFFTIKLALESADQALSSGLIRLNKAYSWTILCDVMTRRQRAIHVSR